MHPLMCYYIVVFLIYCAQIYGSRIAFISSLIRFEKIIDLQEKLCSYTLRFVFWTVIVDWKLIFNSELILTAR